MRADEAGYLDGPFIRRNRIGIAKKDRMTVTWSADGSVEGYKYPDAVMGKIQRFIAKLEPGNVVVIVPIARDGGWHNFTYEANIEIVTASDEDRSE